MLLTEGIGQTSTLRETACQITSRLTHLLTRKQRMLTFHPGLQKVNIWFKEQIKSEICFEKGQGRILPEKKIFGATMPFKFIRMHFEKRYLNILQVLFSLFENICQVIFPHFWR